MLRAKADLVGEVVVLGMTGKTAPGFLEVVNHERFLREVKAAEEQPADPADLSRIGL